MAFQRCYHFITWNFIVHSGLSRLLFALHFGIAILLLQFYTFTLTSCVYTTQAHKLMIIISLIIYFYFYCRKFDPAVVISFVLFIHVSSYAISFITYTRTNTRTINNFVHFISYVRKLQCLLVYKRVAEYMDPMFIQTSVKKTARFIESMLKQKQLILKTTEKYRKIFTRRTNKLKELFEFLKYACYVFVFDESLLLNFLYNCFG